MNTVKNSILFAFLACVIISGLSSCSSEVPLDKIGSAAIKSGNRAKALAAEYKYRTLASYKKGEEALSLSLEQLADLEGKTLNLLVLYDAAAAWAAPLEKGEKITASDMFNGHVEAFGLEIVKTFIIDDRMSAIVLKGGEAFSAQEAVTAAKELSLVEDVMMVEVKEEPQDQPDADATARNN